MKLRSLLSLLLAFTILLFTGCKGRKSQQASPEDIATTKNVGMAYLEENQLDKAESEFLKLIRLVPDDAGAWANLGLVYLRQARYDEAEKSLNKALKISPDDPDIRLILAKIYELSHRSDAAIKVLEETLVKNPAHIKTLYTLGELYSASGKPGSAEKQRLYTSRLVQIVPANIVPRLNLCDLYIRTEETDSALAQLEEMEQVFPEFPKEAREYFDKTMDELRAGNITDAGTSFMIFHNYMKVTPPYQAGILELKGPEGFIGSPVITFDRNRAKTTPTDWREVLEAISFKDITSDAGLILPEESLQSSVSGNNDVPIPMAAEDFDGDGDVDLFLVHNTGSGAKGYLLTNEWGKYSIADPGISLEFDAPVYEAGFADYDNDGFLDLYLAGEGTNRLFHNEGDGTFQDVTKDSGTGDPQSDHGFVFLDEDHDGDLDLYVLRNGPNLMLRNNADGTFTDVTESSGTAGGDYYSTDAAFADFDDDGDIDLFVTNLNGPDLLFSNQRQGVFKEIASEKIPGKITKTRSVSVGDFNNDGFADIFLASEEPGKSVLYRNRGDGSFTSGFGSGDLQKNLSQLSVTAALNLDFDNDGYLDLLVTGTGSEGNNAVLYHNDASGDLFSSPGLLPDDFQGADRLLYFDYNEDGDADLLVSDPTRGVRLLRNDGGNNFHYVKMKLVGLRTGSGKNNYYGIGARVEVRAGNLYQSLTVTRPEILLGLGPRRQADVIRILWTNGVPQNIFYPASNQDLVEEQQLKGSCPFLYTWNGSEYIFVKDVMWRSALGMPLGIMSEDKQARYASAQPSVDYIRIPGAFMQPRKGKYTLKITDELWETIYFDKIRLIAVDHPAETDIYVDEKFMPQPDTAEIIPVTGKRYPIEVQDDQGNNLLDFITSRDSKYTPVSGKSPYQGITETHDLILNLGKLPHPGNLKLFLTGWIFPSDASINAAIAQSGKYSMIPPSLQILQPDGSWKTLIENISFPMGKDKTVIVDLDGRIKPGPVTLRIRTNMQLYWDEIFFTTEQVAVNLRETLLEPESAELHYRGFSGTYRKGGRYGPHWFDYNKVSTGQKWRDLTGYYTRYGDVLPLLLEADDMYIIKNAGDETSITFDASSLPPLPKGWKRDFLVHTVGWVKDGDLNTATGQQVTPLPFHDMTRYPYGTEQHYPQDQKHQEYLKEYNTRYVSTDHFRSAISQINTDKR